MAEHVSMTETQVSEAIETLTKQLKTDRDGSSAFCDCWPCAKRLLNLLKGVVPPVIKAVIDSLIKIGDGVSGSICK
jgi:hypothetical protein